MQTKWTYCAVYSIIQIHFVRGVWEETPSAEAVYALPGSNVDLNCETQKQGFLVQIQWSKITNKEDLIALYHPQHGYYCANGSPCDSLVTFTAASENITKWTLHLRNVSSSLSGKYVCSFTLYPEGIRLKIYDVLIQEDAAQVEWRSNHTIEAEINQTLEIPCFQNIPSDIPSELTFTWLVEHNGTQEILIIKHHLSNSTLLKDRVKLSTNYSLHLSPVLIHDDELMFFCDFTPSPGKILRHSTKVKVFAKPEMPMIAEDNSMDFLGKRTFTCLLNNVFPTANLTWFIDGNSPQGDKEISITNEKRKDGGGFLELKSVLTRVYSDKPAQSNNLTIWCMALAPVPGNKVWNSSSEKITFSLGSLTTPTDLTRNVTELTFSTQPSLAKSTSPASYPATSSISFVDVNTSTPQTTLQTSNPNMTTQGLNYSLTSSGKDVKSSSWMPSETYSSPSSGAGLTLDDDVFTSTTRGFSEVPTASNDSTRNKIIQVFVTPKNPKDGMSWPVIVAALLFFCVVVFGLAVRKWYQYQKEIMERPPPFKPPPPPIKYTCIQESVESDLPGHEMETL